MALLILKHPVQNFDHWYSFFTAAKPVRDRHGCCDGKIWREASDPNSVLILHEFSTEQAAHEFMEDQELHAHMKNAGVAGQVRVEFFDEFKR